MYVVACLLTFYTNMYVVFCIFLLCTQFHLFDIILKY
nr:MAG TPA: hypothetical protein [Caudoviricetes sp.]